MNGEVFTLLAAKVLMEKWTKGYDTIRPHGTPGHKPADTQSESALLTGLIPGPKRLSSLSVRVVQ